jgi:predicted nucleic acid-binding protein
MVFLDTSAFLAIENRRDAHHHQAVGFRDSCLKKGRAFITTDYILDESYTLIRFRAGYRIAVQFGEALRGSRLLRIEHITPEMIEKAWQLFKIFSDHDFSFTDCTSFIVMERLHIQTAFTFDQHFKEYGRFIVGP